MKKEKIIVIGLWHLGLVTAAGLADMGRHVVGFDLDRKRLNDIRSGKLPLYEPGLDELIHRHAASGLLRFEKDLKMTVKDAETVLITYDTPVKDNDLVDLSILEETLHAVTPHLSETALILINSQVPVGSCERWQKEIQKIRSGSQIDIVYSPENIRLGQAIQLFKQPDMIVIGCGSERARKKADHFYASFKSEKFFVSLRTAEMAKHALNVFFATSISFANELGNLCDALGADGLEIAKILKQDSRIGKKAQVRPGLGFAGGTLARDLKALQGVGKKFKLRTPLIDSVFEINRRQIHHVTEMISKVFKGKIRGKVLSVLGLTYKPGTSTLRRSAALEIIHQLKTKGVIIHAHDPKADLSELKGQAGFKFFQDPYEAVKASEAAILLTEWPEYQKLDYEKVKKQMKTPILLDAKNHLNRDEIIKLGFTYLEIGRGQLAGIQP